MRLTISTLLAVLCIMLFIGAGIIWGRSVFVWDTVNQVTRGREWGVGSARGQLTLWTGLSGGADLDVYWNAHEPPPERRGSNWGFAAQRICSVRAVHIPYWFLMGATLIHPACAIARSHRKRRAARIGLCRVCGYDLRASPERCPECGTAVTTRMDAESLGSEA